MPKRTYLEPGQERHTTPDYTPHHRHVEDRSLPSFPTRRVREVFALVPKAIKSFRKKASQ